MSWDKKLVLKANIVHLWYCSITANKNRLIEYKELLSADEKQRASRFKFEKDREGFIICRGILRCLLGNYLKIEPDEIEFAYSSYGKPILAFENDLNFNISHSGNMAVFAFVRDKEIGVDIEKIKTDFDILELAESFFSEREIEVLKKQPKEDLPRAFFRCWTRKESFIKAEGSGLSFPLDKFTVSLENDEQAELLETHWDSKEKDQWRLFSFNPSISYIAAVAVKQEVIDVSYHHWDSD